MTGPTRAKERTHEANAVPTDSATVSGVTEFAGAEHLQSSKIELEAASLSLKPPVLRPTLPNPFTAWNGVVVTNQKWLDLYNRIQVSINSFLADHREPPEELLNSSHRTFVLIVEASRRDA
jgi:hypothetical protein